MAYNVSAKSQIVSGNLGQTHRVICPRVPVPNSHNGSFLNGSSQTFDRLYCMESHPVPCTTLGKENIHPHAPHPQASRSCRSTTKPCATRFTPPVSLISDHAPHHGFSLCPRHHEADAIPASFSSCYPRLTCSVRGSQSTVMLSPPPS